MTDAPDPSDRPAAPRQPAFNLPRVVVGVLAALVAIHAFRTLILSENADLQWIITLAFIPLRFSDGGELPFPGGWLGDLWTFVTYALLHADWMHLGVNAIWLAIFGSPLAWRFGPMRFLAFSITGAIGGSALHLVTHWGDPAPMVGASAAISAHMAGASRFMFRGVPYGRAFGAGAGVYRAAPAATIAEMFSDARILAFIAVWFGFNILFGLLGGFAAGGMAGPVAWQAHIGGFAAGLFLYPLFDPVRRPSPPLQPDSGYDPP